MEISEKGLAKLVLRLSIGVVTEAIANRVYDIAGRLKKAYKAIRYGRQYSNN